MRIGAIDIGSNSIRLLVADFHSGAENDLVTIARAGEACRLGRGLDRTGHVDAEIAERAAVLAAEFARRARSLGAERLVVGATAALRKAENGAEVAASIGERCGERVRVLSGEDEARLVYRAVVLGLGRPARRSACVVFDLGGGSTEVVSGLGEQPGRWASLPFGAVSLTEKFLDGTPRAERLEELEQAVGEQIMHGCALMPATTPMLVGVGGTITVLASMDRGLTTYEPTLIEGWAIEAERLEQLATRILESNESEREAWPVMGKGRADIVLAGVLVVRLLTRRFPSRWLLASTQGLRYGLARLAAEGLGSDRVTRE
jgi:exopolyphosphatase/guanosine-5'-triphosphate,3'-diphosphate pyrophosphatase